MSDQWSGFWYQLAIELSTSGDDARLTAALEALWAQPILRHSDRRVDDDTDVHPRETEFTRFLHGDLALPERQVGCVVVVLREREGSDWLEVCVPSGMMEREGYPMHDPLSDSFLLALDQVFLRLADAVYAVAPFGVALIGEEVSGLLRVSDFSARTEAAEWYVRHGGVLLRPALLQELPFRVVAERRPSGLLYIERSRHVA
jgi:hypothetical protein